MTPLHLVENGEEPSPRVTCMCGSKVPALQPLGQILVTHCLKCCSPSAPSVEGIPRGKSPVDFVNVALFIAVVGIVTTLIVKWP